MFEKVVSACNGEPTIAERLGHREYAFPLLMGGAVTSVRGPSRMGMARIFIIA